jgi:hypothetical protein
MTRLVVKHHRPLRTWLTGIVVGAAFVVAVMAAFAYGEYRAGYDRQAGVALRSALDDANSRDADLNEQIAVLQQQREVDQNSRQQVQSNYEDMQRKLGDLQEQLAFYKGIVSPGAGQEGLHAQSLKFSNGGAPRLYHYKLVLIQLRSRELKVAGSVVMKIYGVQDGKPVMLDAQALAPSGKIALGFAFQYFQDMEGDVFFPESFQPGRVEVTIQENGHETVQQNFDWTSVIG